MANTVFASFEPAISTDEVIGGRYANLKNTIQFGIPDTSLSADGFAIPVIEFTFISPFGYGVEGAPIIFMRAPNSLNLSHASNYNQQTNIFGASNLIPSMTTEGEGDAKTAVLDFLGQTGRTVTEAISKQLFSAAGEKSGYLSSAGQTGIDQFEFSSRNTINPFQQLVYKGTAFKPYTLTFTMRPKNSSEAKAALDIISAFKIAASAKVSNGTVARGLFDSSGESGSLVSGAADSIISAIEAEIPLTFGYPDLIIFRILMYSSDGTKSSASPLYKSLGCAIQNISTDYGQQKMTFFSPINNSTEYYPTEITLTLSLQEIAMRTVEDAFHVDRGYPGFVEALVKLGAKVSRHI